MAFNKKGQMLFFNLKYYVVGFIIGFIVAVVLVFLGKSGTIPISICG